uniref:CCHC-type domain-containing protein n=1 Tax=Macrostomum lignano TaxID=282301 RepID=A0A1I8IWC9_9PLAT
MGQKCRRCGKTNHFAKMCRMKAVSAIDTKEPAESSLTVLAVNNKSTDSLFCECRLGGQLIRLQIDCGAAVSLLNMETFKKSFARHPLLPTSTKLEAYGGSAIKTIGKVELPVTFNGIRTEATFYVADKGANILGRDLFQALGFKIFQDALATATKEDEVLQAVLQYISGGWPTKVDSSLKPYFNVRDELFCWNNGQCLGRGERAIIPTSLRLQVIEEAHEGHPGVVRSKQRCRDTVWFPGIDRQVEDYVKNCTACTLAEKSGKPQQTIRQAKNADYTNKRRRARDSMLQAGDWVWRQTPHRAHKLATRLKEPLKIASKAGRNTFVLSDGTKWQASRLVKCNSPPADNGAADQEDDWFDLPLPPAPPPRTGEPPPPPEASKLQDSRAKLAAERQQFDADLAAAREAGDAAAASLREELRRCRTAGDRDFAQRAADIEASAERAWREKCDRLVELERERAARLLGDAETERAKLAGQLEEAAKRLAEARTGSHERQTALDETRELLDEAQAKVEKTRAQALKLKQRLEEQLEATAADRDALQAKLEEAEQRLLTRQKENQSETGKSVSGELKTVMNGVFQSLRRKIDPNKRYSGEKVLQTLLLVIKKETLRATGELAENDDEEEDEEEDEDEEASSEAEDEDKDEVDNADEKPTIDEAAEEDKEVAAIAAAADALGGTVDVEPSTPPTSPGEHSHSELVVSAAEKLHRQEISARLSALSPSSALAPDGAAAAAAAAAPSADDFRPLPSGGPSTPPATPEPGGRYRIRGRGSNSVGDGAVSPPLLGAAAAAAAGGADEDGMAAGGDADEGRGGGGLEDSGTFDEFDSKVRSPENRPNLHDDEEEEADEDAGGNVVIAAPIAVRLEPGVSGDEKASEIPSEDREIPSEDKKIISEEDQPSVDVTTEEEKVKDALPSEEKPVSVDKVNDNEGQSAATGQPSDPTSPLPPAPKLKDIFADSDSDEESPAAAASLSKQQQQKSSSNSQQKHSTVSVEKKSKVPNIFGDEDSDEDEESAFGKSLFKKKDEEQPTPAAEKPTAAATTAGKPKPLFSDDEDDDSMDWLK